EILKHLNEIDRRKLYLERGYSSLWAYCTEELNYSEAAAQRRIEAMRALEIPELEEKIESGKLTLSSIAKVQSLARKINKSRPVSQAKGGNDLSYGEHKLKENSGENSRGALGNEGDE